MTWMSLAIKGAAKKLHKLQIKIHSLICLPIHKMPSPQQELPAGDHFSFSSPVQGTNDHPDEVKYDTWWSAEENIDVSDNIGLPPQWTDVCYRKQDEYYSSIYREEVISRYRQEMLDMAADLPEYAYELSLRDLVELPGVASSLQETRNKGKYLFGDEKKRKKKVKSRTRRSKSWENGAFLLKMFFPLPPDRRKSRRTSSSFFNFEESWMENSTNGECCKESELTDPSRSNSSKSSSSSASSSSRKMRGCYPFFHTNKERARKR